MKYRLQKKLKSPIIHVKDNIIIKINKEFVTLTGYQKCELLGKSFNEIKNTLHMIASEYTNKDNYTYIIFNKKHQLKEIKICCYRPYESGEKIYSFKEIWNEDIIEKFNFINQLYTGTNKGISIIRVPDLMFLETNDNFLDFLHKNFGIPENKNHETFQEKSNHGHSLLEYLLKEVIYNGKPYYKKEFRLNGKDDSITYWNLSIVPIYVKGKIRYIVQTVLDLTENVLNKQAIDNQNKIIKQQKEELEAIIENMSDGLFVIDKDHKFSLLNNSAKRYIYNCDSMKKIGDTLTHTKYYGEYGQLLQYNDLPVVKVLKGEKLKGFKLTSDGPNGIRHFSVSGSPIYDKDRNLIQGINCFHDITEQVKKDEFIKTQKEEMESIMENMLDGLIVFDAYGKFTKLNKTAKEIFSFKSDNLYDINKQFENIKFCDKYGNFISKKNSIIKKIVSGEKILKYRTYIKADNNFIGIEVNGTPIYNSKDESIAGILIVRDITDDVKNEENMLLKAQLNLLNNIIENMDIGFARYSYPELKIVDINNKAYTDLKCIRPELSDVSYVRGQDYCDIFNVDKELRINDIVENLIKNKKGSFFKHKRIIINGEEKFFKFIHQPLFGINNSIIEMIILAIDISSEVKSRIKMQETLRMQEEVFANISHELKTPLNVIFSTNQLIELYLKNDIMDNKEKFYKCIGIIKQNCYRFTKLINNIVDLSKIEAGFFKLNLINKNIVELTEDIVQSISEYVESKGLNIIFDTNTEEKIIACDPEKIERIILNLISNAIKFSDQGSEIYVNVNDEGNKVEIEVKDNGIGIEGKYLNNIFKRFQQVDKSLSRNSEGSGIGLSLVKSIVEMHKGNITVNSEVGKGSSFKIEFPVKTIDENKFNAENNFMNNKIEMINIEFSDIYSM